MKAALAAALIVLSVAAGGASAGAEVRAVASGFQVEGGFCSGAPESVDTRIAQAVGATAVAAVPTAPVAVLDTGVSEVEELTGRLVQPFDATTGGSDASDVNGRGTELAGIAAGAAGLVRGVSPASPVMPVKVFNRTGTASVEWLVSGINWAVGHGAAAISISTSSLLADATSAEVASLTRATSEAFNKGVIVVTSTGNGGIGAAQLPGSLPHVLTVGGSDLTGARATFSNFGPWVDLVAPTTSLIGPTPKEFCQAGYGVINEAAFAAPAVAGAAALLAQNRPELSAQQRFDVLRSSAADVAPSGRDNDTGFGLLNVRSALSATPPSTNESSREVDDDPYFVRKANAPGHPTLLAKGKKARISGQVSPTKDPSDVYPVRLKKGERLTVSASAAGADSLLALGLWKSSAGDFDVSNAVAKSEIVSTGGFSRTPALKMLAKSTGTYYISVETTDAVDEGDPEAVIPVSMTYQALVSKVTVKAKKKVVRKKRTRQAGVARGFRRP